MMKIKIPLTAIILLSSLTYTTNVYSKQNPHEEEAKRIVESSIKKVFSGNASFYGHGDGFHGRKTANGETFNKNAMTAAHRKLPFGTKVKVTCVSTGKSVVVRINDRGPVPQHRILDLSYGAAKAIGMVDRGVAAVKLEVLK